MSDLFAVPFWFDTLSFICGGCVGVIITALLGVWLIKLKDD